MVLVLKFDSCASVLGIILVLSKNLRVLLYGSLIDSVIRPLASLSAQECWSTYGDCALLNCCLNGA